MANNEHLGIVRQGVVVWNQWRQEHPLGVPKARPDLSGADLSSANLVGANLSSANLWRANLSSADLFGANLSEADLSSATLGSANLSSANLWGADLSSANLRRANLWGANLREARLSSADLGSADLGSADLSSADLREANLFGAKFIGAKLYCAKLRGANLGSADLSSAFLREANLSSATLSSAFLNGADLSEAILIRTDLTDAKLKDCRIYGISVWDCKLDGAEQHNLIITDSNQPTITVDNLKIAQFIYLLLNNAEIREVIDTIARKAVLILGRFTPERKAVLDALRETLRTHGYLPILFDFEKPSSRDLTETISTLAHLARFVIADITDAKSIPQELQAIVPNLPSVPIRPLILSSQQEYGMFEHFRRFPWVLPLYCYTDQDHLLATLHEQVIAPAEQKARELTPPR